MTLPTLNLKQWLGISALVLLTGLGSFLTAKHLFPTVKEVEVGQQQIDKNTWVKRSKYENQRTLNQQLRNTNEELSEQVQRLDRRVTSLTNVNAKLNLRVDSLSSMTPDTVELAGDVRDTTAVFTKTFGDSLFQVSSEVSIKDNNMTNKLDLKQLRPVEITVAQTKLGKEVFVSSEEIDSLRVTSIRSLDEPKYSRTELFIGGTLIGGSVTAILNLIL